MSKLFNVSYKYTKGSQTSSMSTNVHANSKAEAKEKFLLSKKHDSGKIENIIITER